MNKATATKERIILAANVIALEEGIAHLTLEAVATRAAISKGGLLYHYPNKDALIEGMIEYALGGFEARFARRLEDGQAWLAAYIDATLEDNEVDYQTSAGVLAATVVNPDLLHPLRSSYEAWQQYIEDQTSDPVLGTVVRLALDGLWIAHLLNIAPPSKEMAAKVQQRLHELLNESEV